MVVLGIVVLGMVVLGMVVLGSVGVPLIHLQCRALHGGGGGVSACAAWYAAGSRYCRKLDIFHRFQAVAAPTAAMAMFIMAVASIVPHSLLLLPLGRRERLYTSPVAGFALKAGLSLPPPSLRSDCRFPCT
jgi:hypothetical protein